MRPLLALVITAIHISAAPAQNTQWASRVISFSSEASPVEFSSQQILGKPNVLPQIEINPNAWSPGKAKKEQYISVGFSEPMYIKQTAIAEAYNSSALRDVIAIDISNQEHLLYSLTPKHSPQKGRLFNFFISETEYEVMGLKLVFDGEIYGGEIYIDAVAISNSDVPIRVSVDRLNTVKNGLEIKALGKNVNSNQSELRPLLSPDGKTLYFSRKFYHGNIKGNKDEEDIWESKWDADLQAWAPATNAGTSLNSDGKNFVNAVSPNGNSTLLILGSDYESKRLKPGISISNSTPDGWSKPVTMPFYSDPGIKGDFDFTLSSDRKIIIFAVKKAQSHGGKDLFVSFLQRSGVWSEPLNLGPDVNSVSEESAPFLAADGETLYFSSTGFSGFGGSDVYVAKRLDTSWKRWSEPQNLGSEINSESDEKYFNIPPNSQFAYMSRYLTDDNADVFSIKLPIFEEVQLLATRTTESDNQIIEELPDFGNINFKSNQAMLFQETYESLNDLILILKNNSQIRIEISSHTDNIGSEEDNLMLSKQRAEAIFGYLTQTGNIESTRIELKWFGESNPVVTNNTEEGRLKNRRVEFTIKR